MIIVSNIFMNCYYDDNDFFKNKIVTLMLLTFIITFLILFIKIFKITLFKSILTVTKDKD